MGEQPEALQLDPQHLRERDYEAAQAYTDRCPELPLFTEASDKQREARQAAKAPDLHSSASSLASGSYREPDATDRAPRNKKNLRERTYKMNIKTAKKH